MEGVRNLATEIIMPALGMAQETGRIVRWLKASGDRVQQGEPLLQVETDKTVVELEAPAHGMLRTLREADDEGVPIGEVIGWVGSEDEEPPRGETPPPLPAEAGGAGTLPPSHEVEGRSTGPAATESVNPAIQARVGVAMSPKARRLAQERGVDVAALAADTSGPVHAADVLSATTAARDTPAAGGQVRRWNGIAETMAHRTAQSWRQAPHFYLMREMNATSLKEWLAAVRGKLPQATLTDLLIRVAAHVLHRFPQLNASPVEGGILMHDAVNIGVAVATERGLIVPVIHGADQLALNSIVDERSALLARTRDGRATPSDLSGGTFTISNLGMFGIDQFMPVLNLDEALLLAVGRIQEKVVVDNGSIVSRPMMALTLACDHRVVDGASAAEFLREFVAILEQPVMLIQ